MKPAKLPAGPAPSPRRRQGAAPGGLRKNLILPLLLLGLTLSAAGAAERPPNIVIIFTDDQGYADAGRFGAEGFKTPNLDRMADAGAVFRNFHVPQPVCSASRAGLLTGCYPNRVGIHGALRPQSPTGLSSNEVTLAELVRQRGYATGMFGKWHLGDAPQFLPPRHGFDEYFGLPYSNDMWPQHPSLRPLAPETRKLKYPDLPLFENERIVIPQVTPEDQDQLTTWYTEHAVRFIGQHQARPFFLYVAHSMPHVPLHVSAKFRGTTPRGLYGDVMAEIDWSVGQILAALKRHGLDDDTLVIFTSDNGPWLSYGDHGGSAKPLREGKGTCWEGGTREPCIMRWPGHIPAGADTGDMLMTIDLFPTIARLVGADLPPHKIDGLDVWPIISRQPGAKNPHAAYWYYYGVNELQAVTSGDGRWKLQLPHTYRTLAGQPGGQGGVPAAYAPRKIEKAELYDLSNDRGEATDLAARHPDIVRRLEAEAEKARAELGDTLTQRAGPGAREPGRLAVPSPDLHSRQSNCRALHLVLKKMTPDGIKALISQAKGAGFNTLVLALADEVRFDAFTNSETATWSKAEFMGVVEYARQQQLEVIPELALLTHQGNFLKRSRPDLMFNAQTYDPRKGKVYEIVFPILDELIAGLHPRAIHIGHDEAVGWTENHWKKGLLQPGEQQLPADLFLDDVKRLQGYLQKKGVETWMWGDMLIAPDEFPTMTVGGAINGRTPGYGKMLRQKIPREIVICDWHYIGAETNFSSVAAFQADGFRVLGATWENPTTIRNFSRAAAAQGAAGMIATTWFHVRSKQPEVVDGIIRESGAAFRKDFPDAK